ISTRTGRIEDFHLIPVSDAHARSFTPLIDFPINLYRFSYQAREILPIAGLQHVRMGRKSHDAVAAGLLEMDGCVPGGTRLLQIYPGDSAAHLYDLPQPARIVRTRPEMRQRTRKRGLRILEQGLKPRKR